VSLEGSSISHYRIEAELGRGGMGVVYKAVDSKLDRTVALKLLPSSALTSEEDRARFYREAKAAAQLHHPHIASIFEIDEAVLQGAPGDEPRPFIAMEYIEGSPLDAMIKASPLPLPEVVNIARQIAEALSEAHGKDIVHRDIKSANVMVTSAGKAKVLDFGLAKTAQSTMLTRMGSTMGTIAYMSPEQARGESVDHRTDLWALGVIIHEMTTGTLPFGGDYEQAIVYSIMNEDAEPLTALRTGVPMELERIVNKLLAKKATSRYASASDLMVDLESLAEEVRKAGSSSRMTARMTVKRASRPGSRSAQSLTMVLAALTVLFGLTAIWLALRAGPETPDSPPMALKLVFDDLEGVGYPAFSPDGSHVVFLAYDTSAVAPGQYIHSLASGQRNRVPGLDEVGFSTWSPDGTRLAYSDLNDNVMVIRPDGSNRSVIGSYSNTLVTWSSNQSILLDPEDGILREYHLDGRGEEVLAEPDPEQGERYYWWPRPLPGDRYLLFSAVPPETSSEATDIRILDRRTGEHAPLIEDGEYPFFVSSGHILFLRGDEDMLMAQPFNLESRTVSGPAVDLFPVTFGSMAVSETADALIYRSGTTESTYDFSFLESDREPFSITLGAADIMAISRDGTVAVSRATTEDEVDLFVLDPASGYEAVLTRRSVIEAPIFSPDGASLGYLTTDAGRFRIHAIDMTSRERILDLEVDGLERIVLHDWHPDGNRILLTGSPGDVLRSSAHVLDLDTGEISPFLDPNLTIETAGYDPSGAYLAYTESTPSSYRVWISPSDGSGRVAIEGDYIFESWLPDRQAILVFDVVRNALVEIPLQLDRSIRVAGSGRDVIVSEDIVSGQVLSDGSILLWDSHEADDKTNHFDLITSFRRYLNEVAPPLDD